MTERVFGVLKELTDVRDFKLERPAKMGDENFPECFELTMPEIKDQGSVGSCVAHALASVVEYYNTMQEKNNCKMSVGFIYGNRSNSSHKGSGMYVRDALKNTVKYGDTYLEDFKENVEVPDIINLFNERIDTLKDKAYPNRFSSYFKIRSDNDLKYSLMTYGPVVFAMNWYSDIKILSNGVISTEEKASDILGGHCMVIYGWDERGWKIQNSWGSNWGKRGRAILPFAIKRSETWGVTDEVTGESEDIKKPFFNSVIGKLLAKVLNFILNLVNRRFNRT